LSAYLGSPNYIELSVYLGSSLNYLELGGRQRLKGIRLGFTRIRADLVSDSEGFSVVRTDLIRAPERFRDCGPDLLGVGLI
jgi:hypothetical protein